jgi:hypothetical protein
VRFIFLFCSAAAARCREKKKNRLQELDQRATQLKAANGQMQVGRDFVKSRLPIFDCGPQISINILFYVLQKSQQ